MNWKFWAGFFCLFVLGAWLRLVALTTGPIHYLEAISALAWLIGGYFIYVLSHRFSSIMGAMICLAYYYLLPLGIITDQANPAGPLMVFWLAFAFYGLYWFINKPKLFWIAWGIVCLVTMLLGLILLESLSLPNAGERIAGNLKLAISPVFYIRWFEKIHGNLDLLLVLIGAAAIFLLSKPLRNFLIGIWLIYIVAVLTFPTQAMKDANFHQQLIPCVAISLGVMGASFYKEISPRGKAWQTLFFAVFTLAVLISTGYAWKKVINAAELSAILSPLDLSIFHGIGSVWF